MAWMKGYEVGSNRIPAQSGSNVSARNPYMHTITNLLHVINAQKLISTIVHKSLNIQGLLSHHTHGYITYLLHMHCCTVGRGWQVPPSQSVRGCVSPPPRTTPTSNTKFPPWRPLFDTWRRLFTCCRCASGTVWCQTGAGTNNSGKQRNTEEGRRMRTLRAGCDQNNNALIMTSSGNWTYTNVTYRRLGNFHIRKF